MRAYFESNSPKDMEMGTNEVHQSVHVGGAQYNLTANRRSRSRACGVGAGAGACGVGDVGVGATWAWARLRGVRVQLLAAQEVYLRVEAGRGGGGRAPGLQVERGVVQRAAGTARHRARLTSCNHV
ncbi:hypothetical protein RR46_04722 [Papilio xuthus]|uniref:Uncharacterized protein n=1 Tax=Papilio xuthus TaxID=66420 RepID=A0A194Q330_PAPXU|nr:hypothetical protein RR46_04722 [Papilio xuthus]